jgi:phosphatidylglycerophosphate synthase
MSAREVYQRTAKVPDLFWNRFVCRPVAAVLVDALKDTRITPNQVTLASFAVALISVMLLIALPGYAGLVTAIVVFQISYVLDCVDGMLARWRGTASQAGHLLDFLMDEIKAFLMLAAATVRLQLEAKDQPYWLIGLIGLAALASGIGLTSFLRHPEIARTRASETAGATPASQSALAAVIGQLEALGKLLIHYPSYILFAALAGRLDYYLFPYAAINLAYAARTFLMVAVRFGRA